MPAPRIDAMPAATRKVVDGLLESLSNNGFVPESVTYEDQSRAVTFWFWTDHTRDGARSVVPFSLAVNGRIVPFVTSTVPMEATAGAVPTPVEAKAAAAVQRSITLSNSWPKVGPGQGVPAGAVLRCIAPLRPVAEDILARPVGSTKGTIAGPGLVPAALTAAFPLFLAIEAVEGPAQPGTGYLSGAPVITAEDHALAQAHLNLIDVGLPGLGATLIGSGQLSLVKEGAHRLLAVATDLDINTTAADEVALLAQSMRESVKDLAGGAQRKADEGLSTLKTALLVFAGAAGVYAVATAPWKRR